MDGFDISTLQFNTEMVALAILFAIFLVQNNNLVRQSKKIGEEILIKLHSIDTKTTESNRHTLEVTKKIVETLERMEIDAREWRRQNSEEFREFRTSSSAEHRELLAISQRTYEQAKIRSGQT